MYIVIVDPSQFLLPTHIGCQPYFTPGVRCFKDRRVQPPRSNTLLPGNCLMNVDELG